jgi:DNA polymerase
LSEIKTLDNLWKYTYDLNKINFPNNERMPVFGNGRLSAPKFMFVFINPTRRNISSDPHWRGPRFPFVGTKQIWRVFHRAGFFDSILMEEINKNSDWSFSFASRVLDFMKEQRFYFTNIVKWTGKDAALPDSKKISIFLPVLEREIEIVKPEYIVAFGLIPFERLTGQKIKLGEYYADAKKRNALKLYSLSSTRLTPNVIPCYFPIGRGNPARAVDILKMLHKLE